MIIISHRGNIDSAAYQYPENSFKAIENAISLGFHVEVDIRYIDKKWYLGHDKPEYEAQMSFLDKYDKYLWLHAKDLETYYRIWQSSWHRWRFFLHDTDDMAIVLPSHVWWTYPKRNLYGMKSVAVLPECYNSYSDKDLFNCGGICTDYPLKYRGKYYDYMQSMQVAKSR